MPDANPLLADVQSAIAAVEARVGATTADPGSKRLRPEDVKEAAQADVKDTVQSGIDARFAKRRKEKADREAEMALLAAAIQPAESIQEKRAKWTLKWTSLNLDTSSSQIDEGLLVQVLDLLRKMPVLFCKDMDCFKKVGDKEMALKRADVVAAVSALTTDLEQLKDAAVEYLPHLTRVMELKNAMVKNLHTERAEDLRELIEEAESPEMIASMADKERAKFIEDYRAVMGVDPPPHEIPKPSCPYGNIVMGPSMDMAPPRFGKSWPAVGFALLCRKVCDADILWSVAPNKTVVMAEILKKLELSGCKEAGVMNFRSTLGVKIGSEEAESLVNSDDYDCLVWSSDEPEDVDLYAKRCYALRDKNRLMVKIHDEADTLIKPDKVNGDSVLDRMKEFFPTSWGYTMLVGATMLPLFQEKQLWGSLLEDDDFSPYYALRPLRPVMAKGAGKYVSVADTANVVYDDGKEGRIHFTKAKVLKRAEEIIKERCTEQVAQLSKKIDALSDPTRKDPLTRSDHPLNKKCKHMPLVEMCQHIDNEIVLSTRGLDRLRTVLARVSAGDFGPIDPSKPKSKPLLDRSGADSPFIPKGLVKYGTNPITTAKIECYFISLLHRDATILASQDASRFVNQMFLATITQQVKSTGVKKNGMGGCDGGMAQWASKLIKLAHRFKKPAAILLYSSQISKNNINVVCPGFTVGEKFQSKLPVKLLECRTETHQRQRPDGSTAHVVTAKLMPINSFDDSDAAFRWMCNFEQSGLTHDSILETHVGIIGYDMLKAATTVANERTLTITDADGTERTIYVLFSPKYSVFAHNDDRQLNALFQMFGRSCNQLSAGYEVRDYVVHVLTHDQTLDMLRVYAEGEARLADFLHSCEKADLQYIKVVEALKSYFDHQKAWHGDITDQVLGLRKVKVSDQFKEVKNVEEDVLATLMENLPEDQYGCSSIDFDEEEEEASVDAEVEGPREEGCESDEGDDEVGVDPIVKNKCIKQVGYDRFKKGKQPYSELDRDVWQPVANEAPYKLHRSFVPRIKTFTRDGDFKPALDSAACRRQMESFFQTANYVAKHHAAHPLILNGQSVDASQPNVLVRAICKDWRTFMDWAMNKTPGAVTQPTAAMWKDVMRKMARNYYDVPCSEIMGD